MLDTDLAALYQVSAGALLQAVKRNRKRFPEISFSNCRIKSLQT